MDNIELHYVAYDPDEVWNEMIYNYVEAGGDVLYPGDEKEMLLRSVQEDIVQVFAGIDNALRMQTLRYAVGDYLDVIGEKRGCERIAATAAAATVSITTNATGEAGTLAAGTVMTADGEVFYALDEDIALTGYQQTVTATITATAAGSAGNGLTVGAEMVLYIGNPAIYRIEVTAAATGGTEAEDDETYRERIREHTLTAVTTGPARQYEAAAEAANTSVIDAKALRGGAGEVNVYLIIDDDATAAGIISEVTAALSADDVRPLTDSVTVSEAAAISYVLNVQYASDGSSSVTSAVAEAVTDYQEWQDDEIGRAFNPDRLVAALYQAGATRVIWGSGSTFNGSSTIQYAEIGENERCKGTITLTAI